jgi:serine protease AprX
MRGTPIPRSLLLTALFFVIAFSVFTASLTQATIDANPPASFTTPKALQVVADQTRAILPNRSGSIARVWVFFTDKGVFDRRAFTSAAQSVQLSDRVMARRAKTGNDKVLFLDLPVDQNYIQTIENLGATLRHDSKWLNAASFDMSVAQVDQVASLPFVREIRPVAGYVRPQDPAPTDERPAAPNSTQNANVTYGNSLGQLNLMGVPAVHTKGYNGQGVILAVFDTGFRKAHDAFANAYAEGRVLAEHDFVYNDGDVADAPGESNAWSHGTSTWSLAGGFKDGTIVGGAYKATFILAKTEDVRSEKNVEEDNWVAALQWADSLGVDVITSSLGYDAFDAGQHSYVYADKNGATATISIAASTAASLGIVVCNSMGNSGPGVGTLSCPADAFDILSIGAVTSGGLIASFSSRGPTADNRIKPEICAQGVSTWVASSSGNTSYSFSFNGTSAACPLAAGAAALLVQARPTWPPTLIRQALMETASQAATPDNNYGWGIVNVERALNWGINFHSSVTSGSAPLTVNFTDSSQLSWTSVLWDFGDGNTSTATNPSHNYTVPGFYTVSLTAQTAYGPITNEKVGLIAALADTLFFGIDSAFAGEQVVKSVRLKNSQPLVQMVVPFKVATSPLRITLDSIQAGSRIASYSTFIVTAFDQGSNRFRIQLDIDTNNEAMLPAGNGELLKLYMTSHPYDLGGLSDVVDSAIMVPTGIQLLSPKISYTPTIVPGAYNTKPTKRGDMNRDTVLNLADLSRLVSYLTGGPSTPPSLQSGDWNADLQINLADLSSMVSWLTTGAPDPVNP